MKAVVFHKPGDMRVDETPDPGIEHEEDIIVRVTSTAICGSDLHIYNGFFPQTKPLVMGHEFMGVVEETGKGVTTVKRENVWWFPSRLRAESVSSASRVCPAIAKIQTGEIWPRRRLDDQKGGGLFGYTDLYGGYPILKSEESAWTTSSRTACH